MTDAPPAAVAADRYVTIGLYATISGYSANAIRLKIRDGVWVEGQQYIRAPDNHILIDRTGVHNWMARRSK